MDAEGKQIWNALCRVSAATEDDRAEAADQRAQADEEKAEAERNIADSDQLKEAARAALGFPKESIFPGEAAQVMHNRVVQHQNAQNPATGYGMSEDDEDEDESSDKKAYNRGGGYSPDGDWIDADEDHDYDDTPNHRCEEQDEWSGILGTAFQTSNEYGWRFVKMVKAMGWKITSEDYEVGDEIEDYGRDDWELEFGAFTVNGKGGQKISLPRGKSIVLDRRVSADIGLWAKFDTEEVSFEFDTGKETGNGWDEPREPIMYDWDVECPEADKIAEIGFSYDPGDYPVRWFKPNQLDKMLEYFALTFPREFKIRSKVKKRGDRISKEGQAIRAALGFQKEAGRLNLGRVVQTRGVSSKARENRAFGKEVQDAFRKYQRGDWGDTERDSVKRNNAVVKDGVEDQVFAVYDTSEGKMYIITEWDGSVTTMLFSHEY